MRLEVKDALILRADNPAGAVVGVVQTRKADARGRMTNDGLLGVVANGNGREVQIFLSPDEARELGSILIATAFAAASVPIPMFATGPKEGAPPGLITQ